MAPFDENWLGDQVFFAGIVISLSFWGFYICTFVVMLLKLKASKVRYTPAVTGVIFLFILNFITTVVDAVRIYRWFWNELVYELEIVGVLTVLQDLLFLLSTVTTDAILWWRLYIIWSRDRRILIGPILSMIGYITIGIFLVVYELKVYRGPDTRNNNPAFIAAYNRWAEATILVELGQLWVVTLLVIGKLYWVGHRVAALTGAGRGNKYRSIILALVESGILLSVVLGIYVGFRLAQCKNMAMILNYGLVRVIGIVPVLIILKLSLGFTQQSDTPSRPQVGPKDPEAVLQVVKPIPAARPPRKDSLSFPESTPVLESSSQGDTGGVHDKLGSSAHRVAAAGQDAAQVIEDAEKQEVPTEHHIV